MDSKSTKPENHKRPYSAEDREKLKEIAKECTTKTIMEMIVDNRKLPEQFKRTKIAICKQIETINGVYWATKD